MFARRANLRCLLADIDVTAVAAYPHGILVVILKDNILFQVGKQFAVALFVGFFNTGNTAHGGGNRLKAFRVGGVGKFLIHFGPFIMFTICGVRKVGDSVGDVVIMEQLKPELCVFLFIVCRFLENSGNLFVSIFFSLAGIVGILVAGLTFAGECGGEICFGFASLEFHDDFLL